LLPRDFLKLRFLVAIYLDYAASSPLRQVARDAYISALAVHGNPSSTHRDGQAARRVLDDARITVAASLGCDPIEVVFTSGGTESVNLGITGLYRSRRLADPARVRILSTAAEHHATVDTLEALAKNEGAVIEWLPVDAHGAVKTDALAAALGDAPETIALITLLWANNEVGTLTPIAPVSALAASARVPLHIDAVAAWGHEPIAVRELPGISALSVSGHKVGSVPGVGALYVARTATLEPLIHGGGQQRGLRSGTQDAPAAASMAAAIDESLSQREQEESRLRGLRDDLCELILAGVSGSHLTGSPDERLNNNVHFRFEGCSSADLLYLLDEAGISVSAGSACQAGVERPSHVLLAMGFSEAEASSPLRITLGFGTSSQEINACASALPAIVAQARLARG
jgi:cysteine desulfurase